MHGVQFIIIENKFVTAVIDSSNNYSQKAKTFSEREREACTVRGHHTMRTAYILISYIDIDMYRYIDLYRWELYRDTELSIYT